MFGCGAQRLHVVLVARLSVSANHWFGARKPVADPRAVVENQLETVSANDGNDFASAQRVRISLQPFSERGFLIRGQVEVLANWIIGTNLAKQFLKLDAETLAARGYHLGHQQAGDDAVFLGHVAANRESGRLFAADGDLVVIDELADVFEPDRSLVERHLVMLR